MSAPKFADSHNIQVPPLLAKPLKVKQFWATAKVKTVNGEVHLQALVVGKKVIITETSVRRDLQLEDAEGIECLPNADIFEQLALICGPTEPIADEAANGENVPTQSNDPPLLRFNTLESVEYRLKLKELMDLCIKLFDRFLDMETTKTAQAKEITSLKKRVKKLERKWKSKTPGMKRLFKIGRSAQVFSSKDKGLGDQEDASKQGRKIDDIDKDQSEKVVEEVVSIAEVSAAATITTEEITLAQALAELRSVKPKVVVQEPVQSTTTTTPSTIPKAKSISFRDPGESTTRTTLTPIPLNIKNKSKAKMIKHEKPFAELRSTKPNVVVQEPVQSTTTTTPSTIPKAKSITFRDPGESITRTTLTPIPSNIKDKGKAKMIELEKPLKMKEQIRLDEELAFKLQAEEEEEATREKAEKVEEANNS
ncbi:hypothetical protein Tco_1025441 [Tanacetum coccineum]